MMPAFAALAVACLGIVAGWLVVPWASNVLLGRACRRADSWWDDSLRGYAEFKRAHAGSEPDGRASGLEGALGIWRDDATASALSGSLTDERLRAMGEAGFEVEGLPSAGTDEERSRRFSVQAGRGQRLLCAVLLGASFCAAAFFAPNIGAAAALCMCVGAMAVALVCDLRARTIPLEACAVLLLAGVLFQAFAAGLEGVLCGVLAALALGGAAVGANRMLRTRFPGGAIGRGDVRCMGALAVATGSGAVCGFAACYALAGLAAVLGCAAKRIAWNDGVPMAPFLAAWLAAGAATVLGAS
ncbi:MAG: prepilin peptidase [Gordonibacter sp.]|uniref:peptidase A24 n=1 Tax=Gordonibacter sp. TaxID=1968902 RepID=UPI002FC77D5C